jgi:hypothetical protein
MSAISEQAAAGLEKVFELNKTVKAGYRYFYIASNDTIELRYIGNVSKPTNPSEPTDPNSTNQTLSPTNTTNSNTILIIVVVIVLMIIIEKRQ